MPVFIIIGTVMTCIGLIGLLYCMVQAARLRQKGNDGTAHGALRRLIAINYAALGIASLGLCIVIIAMVL